MHVLVLPSSFPNADFPVHGIFYQQQALALHNAGIKIGVIVPDIYQFKYLLNSKLLRKSFITYTDESCPFPVFRKSGFNILPLFSFFQKFIFRKYAKQLFQQYINKYGTPDIIHAHTSVWAGYTACVISKKTGIPVILTEHSSGLARNLFDKWQRKSMAYAVNNSSSIIAVSDKLKNDIQKYYPTAKEISVIPNIINVSRFKLDQNSFYNRHKLVTVANLNQNKGIDILIKAFKIASEKLPELTLTIAGDGDQKQNLIILAKSFNLENKIQFTGSLPPEEIAALFNNSGLFVSSSYFETFGVAIAEALSCGLPVVVTKSGGPEEFVNPGNGLLCNPGDPQELADCILTVISKYSTFVPEQIRQEIINRFGPEIIVQQLQKQYDSSCKMC
ncbi:MAG: glycosyltransferase [Bacteroidales bacterium]|jgi:glycosyltransferase involved in cell wall biosynthesis|nr:glycosyltransferase [Bacteroidales bacterium]